jgi:hypothetical protein
MVDIDDAVPGRGWHLQQGVRDTNTFKCDIPYEHVYLSI